MGELSGLRVAYAAFEGYPNRKGSGTRITEIVRALVEAGAEVSLFTLVGDARDALLPPGVKHHPLAILEDNYLARALSFRDAVARALYATPVDVVHVRGPFEYQAARTVADRSGARVVLEVNGFPSVELPYHYPAVGRSLEFVQRLDALERAACRSADLVVTQSQSTAAFLQLRSGRTEGLVVIPNGADPSAHAPSARHVPGNEANGGAHAGGAASGPPSVLYAGSLAPWQGLRDLLLAVRRVAREREVMLRMMGAGRRRWRRKLERAVRRLGIEHVVEIGPALHREVLAQAVADADICVAPLPRDRRNRLQGCSPIKLFEYMAAGRAVLATDLPCVREIVDHDQTGHLVRPSAPRRLAEGLLALCDDPARRQRLGARARAAILESGTWAHRRAALVQAYVDAFRPERARARSAAYAADSVAG